MLLFLPKNSPPQIFTNFWMNYAVFFPANNFNFKALTSMKLRTGQKLIVIPCKSAKWSLSFDIYPHGVTKRRSSIVHLTIGNNVKKYGDRSPGIWFKPSTTKLKICSAINGSLNSCYRPNLVLPIHSFTNLNITETKIDNRPNYRFQVIIGGKKYVSEINFQARDFKNVRIYASNPWHLPANATIRNLIFESHDESHCN